MVRSAACVTFAGNAVTIVHGSTRYCVSFDIVGVGLTRKTRVLVSEWDGDNLVSDATYSTYSEAFTNILCYLVSQGSYISLADIVKLEWLAKNIVYGN